MLSVPIPMQEALQAAGHPGCQQGGGVFTKPSVQQEVDFYAQLLEKNSPLLDVVPVYMGTLTAGVQLSEGGQVLIDQGAEKAFAKDGQQSPGDPVFRIVLKDELAGYINPTIADIKLGFQLYDNNASPSKKQRLEHVANNTTSGSLGFRIAGMSVVLPDGSRKQYDKLFGREASQHNVQDYLAHLFPQIEDEYVLSVVDSVIERIEYVISCLIEEPTKMHSCSVLIIYEGDLTELKQKVDAQLDPETAEIKQENSDSEEEGEDEDEELEKSIVSVRLIDFAHSSLATDPDTEVITGLQNLVHCLQQLKPN